MSGMYSYLGLFLCMLFACCCSATPSSLSGSHRSILREVNDNDKGVGDHPDYGVELNATNFDAVLKDTPATFAIVEFFAHWLVIIVSIKFSYLYNYMFLHVQLIDFSTGY